MPLVPLLDEVVQIPSVGEVPALLALVVGAASLPLRHRAVVVRVVVVFRPFHLLHPLGSLLLERLQNLGRDPARHARIALQLLDGLDPPLGLTRALGHHLVVELVVAAPEFPFLFADSLLRESAPGSLAVGKSHLRYDLLLLALLPLGLLRAAARDLLDVLEVIHVLAL